jgi:hypothetical protein
MSGPEHHREAERLLKSAADKGAVDPFAAWWLEMAKVHTALPWLPPPRLGGTRSGPGWAPPGTPARLGSQPSLIIHGSAPPRPSWVSEALQ